MDTDQIILAVFAAVLIVFSLTVALVIPRRNPSFPAGKSGIFFTVAALLVAGMLLGVVFFGAEDAEDLHAAPAETEAAQTGEAPAETGGAETGAPSEPSAPAGDAAAGEAVWAEAGCGSCHTLAAAGASGTVGPNLDDVQPSFELVVERVTNGAGAMPAFGQQGLLDETQIQDVAAYVVQATQG